MNFIKTEKVPPDPSIEIMNWKSLGYEPQQAIADLIDNSISAGAKNIWINTEWRDKDTVLSVTDDGIGMNEKELSENMKFGSQDQNNIRSKNDLGRFGLGMKVASISKCNTVTVISKTKNSKEIHARTWDVDYVKKESEWALGTPNNINQKSTDKLKKMESGTSVIWDNIDSLDWSNLENAKEYFFSEYGNKLIKYIETYYHRFLERKNFNIYVGSIKCEPWDPFLEQLNPTVYKNETIAEGVNVSAYILPHENSKKPDEKDFEEWKNIRDKGGGIKGWQQQQGIYFYRNNRLIVNGEWLDNKTQEAHHVLARIKVDIPSDFDLEWSVDIKKSSIQPKGQAYNRLKSLSSQLIQKANEVYRYRGAISVKKSKDQPETLIWKSTPKKNGSLKMRINRQHPAIKDFIKFQKELSFEQVLHAIETNLDYNALQINLQKNKGIMDEEVENKIRDKQLIYSIYKKLIKIGLSKKEAAEQLVNIEPAFRSPEIINQIQLEANK